jgi:hypothetical protein
MHMSNRHESTVKVLVLLLAAGGAAAAARAADAGRAGSGQVSAIETLSLTHVGEGSAGRRRVFRNGCYQSESRGGTGGGQAHDSNAGCTTARSFADMFTQADALVADGVLVPEDPAAAAAAVGRIFVSALDDAMTGLKPVLVCADGRRLVARDKESAQHMERIVGMEPSIDAWYVTPPKPAIGSGAQLIALSVQKSARSSSRMLQASLVATGAWWCHLSVPTLDSDAPQTFSQPTPRPLSPTKAAGILDRVLAGISARALAEDAAKDLPAGDSPILVEAAVGAGPRTHVRSTAAAPRAVKSFGNEMRAQSSACLPP